MAGEVARHVGGQTDLLGEGREDVQDAFGPIYGIPASFLISKDGKVCRKHMGIAPKAVFEKEITALLATS